MPQLLDALMHRLDPPIREAVQRVSRAPSPLVFMHVPKTGGAALIDELRAALTPERLVRGFDRCLFGGFDAFETMSEAERSRIFVEPADLPYRADLVVGHMAFTTLRAAYPTGRLVTVLREPVCRLLSHWTYWRTSSDAQLQELGGWGEVVRTARRPLEQFLEDPRAACQTDNVATRMLLWPHDMVPDGDFIDPAHDATLLRLALARLDMFAAVDIAELPDRTALAHSFGQSLGHTVANETMPVPPALRTDLHAELTPRALDRLQASARLDAALWQHVGHAQLGAAAFDRLRNQTLLLAIARHSTLLRGLAE